MGPWMRIQIEYTARLHSARTWTLPTQSLLHALYAQPQRSSVDNAGLLVYIDLEVVVNGDIGITSPVVLTGLFVLYTISNSQDLP